MSSFRMPEFYMPYQARLNPNLESASAHAEEWVRAVGMVRAEENHESDGNNTWSFEEFTSKKIPLFCAYTHPDASADRLNTVVDWYICKDFINEFIIDQYKKTLQVFILLLTYLLYKQALD